MLQFLFYCRFGFFQNTAGKKEIQFHPRKHKHLHSRSSRDDHTLRNSAKLQNQNKLSGAQRRFASEGGESFEKRDALTNQRKNKNISKKFLCRNSQGLRMGISMHQMGVPHILGEFPHTPKIEVIFEGWRRGNSVSARV